MWFVNGDDGRQEKGKSLIVVINDFTQRLGENALKKMRENEVGNL